MRKITDIDKTTDRILQKIKLNAVYGDLKGSPVPIKFSRLDQGYMTKVSPGKILEIIHWCRQNFNDGEWSSGMYYIWLTHPQQVTLFSLRWA